MAAPLRILTVVGARPQIIKAASITRAIADLPLGTVDHHILHTGQHYDHGMSDVFFEELGMPRPDSHLGVGSASHGKQTARMIEGIEERIIDHRPDVLLVFGDTNSTLAGAVAASKLHVPLAHVEAGLRSFNKRMPEEINRILCDHCSTWLFCPTNTAVDNLLQEGFAAEVAAPPSMDRPAVLLSGDVMLDNSLHFARLASERSDVLERLGIGADRYMLATIHRDSNTDDPERLSALLGSLMELGDRHGVPVVLPAHPRTAKQIQATLAPALLERLQRSGGPLRAIPPVGFLDMIQLEKNARVVLTDSGGVQKEAYFFGRPCIVLRAETEWVELVENGQAILAEADRDRIIKATDKLVREGCPPCPPLFGDGRAGERVIARLLADLA